MKKKIVLLLCCMSLFLSGCGNETESKPEENQTGKVSDSQGKTSQSMEGLRLLCNETDIYAGCSTDSGYYYLVEESVKLNDTDYGMHLMYMDYASRQEVYLCSDTGCKHNTADCTAVFLSDDFPLASCKIFVYEGHLYVLSKEYDNDGSVSTGFSVGENDVEIESKPVVLYQMNLDGTNRQVFYTFENGLMLEDFVMASDQGLYVITKKLSSDSIGNSTYTTSTERNLVFLDMEKKTTEVVCAMDFGDPIDWKTEGCYGQKLVLKGIDYGREVSLEEQFEDDVWKTLYENSDDVIALLDIGTGELEEVYRISNKTEHSDAVLDGVLYVSYAKTGEIKAIDLTSREETLLCTLEQSYIFSTLNDTLCCRVWDLAGDQTFYFVDTETGQVHHSSLVNKSLEWALELQADLGEQVLVIYDYAATDLGDGSYEITQYKYALISKEDLFAGKDNYQPIHMIGRGR